MRSVERRVSGLRLPMVLHGMLSLTVFALVSVASAEPLSVWVTIPPQKYLAERVGGDRVVVEALVPPGRSPATYAPTVREMARLAKSQVFFAIGLPVERAVVPRIEATMPGLRLVRLVPDAGDHHHHHDDHDHDHHAGACSADSVDPHVWLDPSAVVTQVERMRAVLTELDPEGAAAYASGAAALVADLQALDAELRVRMEPHKGRAFFINHPSLGHFAAAYGLRQMAVEEGGDAPGARRLAELVAEARGEQVGAVLSQMQFEGSSVEVLADALGVEVIEINPLEEDYFACLGSIADAVEAAFGAL